MRPIKIIYFIALVIIANSCIENDQDNASIETIAVKNITASSAESGGIISPDGIQTVISQGICWSKKENPTLADNYSNNNDGSVSFKCNIINLNADSTYYARAFYVTSKDTVYGNMVEFTTPNYILFNPDLQYGTVTDVDGNVYKTITLGKQTWMAENLKVTHFRNGEAITNETDLGKWGYFQITTSAYCWYNNDIANKNIYGAMYNWYAASDSRNIAPLGWHVSSVDDWQTLISFLGAPQINNGYKLRETSTAHWVSENFSLLATNETGFTALPGGKVAPLHFGFMDIGVGFAYFWTNSGTWDGSSCVYLASDITIDNLQPNCRGFNIRCVKD